jgi:hypothetical protein
MCFLPLETGRNVGEDLLLERVQTLRSREIYFQATCLTSWELGLVFVHANSRRASCVYKWPAHGHLIAALSSNGPAASSSYAIPLTFV